MYLVLPSGKKIKAPTTEQIRQALTELDLDSGGDCFLILEKGEMNYLQASGDMSSGFDLEYQEGDVQKHFRADREDFTLDEATRAFGDFLDGNTDWTRYGTWSKIAF